jgi:2'-5' RNA ligase
MIRLFIAIDIPDSVKEQIANICYGIPRARWVPMDQLHLTVRFIGEAEEAVFEDLRLELEHVNADSFELTLKGVGFFPPRRDPSVLWVGVEENDLLVQLANRIDPVLRQVGIEPEKRKFHPHITIARFKDPQPAAQVMPFIMQQALFAAPSIPVKEYHLYSSKLTGNGAIHTIEASYRLM